ncbi:hypothetical protein GCM10012285_53500 [Streptomyces kronopolitis]|uniref:Uncharacterized protein n=1 Tax=Streptomyces kronopolitis TaxID=1612435 RepID=A0ABQ2JY07_9ACTN|nr:hypothetical protein GCM10012285_53500 [Streptomyces kronopolitis]
MVTLRIIPAPGRPHRAAVACCPPPYGRPNGGVSSDAPYQTVVAAVTACSPLFAALRTASATAPATFSLKTLGMM